MDQNDNCYDAILSASTGGGSDDCRMPQKQEMYPTFAGDVTSSQSKVNLTIAQWHNYSTTLGDDVSRRRRRRHSDDSATAARSRDHLARRYSDFIVGQISARWPTASVDAVSGLADRGRRRVIGNGSSAAGSFSAAERNRFRAKVRSASVYSDGHSSEDDVDVTGEWNGGRHIGASDRLQTSKTASQSDGSRRNPGTGRRLASGSEIRRVNK